MKNKLNVLLVDDSELIIYHLKEMLHNVAGITIVGAAGTLPNAQQMVNDLTIDIIILDIQLPDGNGIDFLKWVRFTNPKIVVIMLSNQADECHRAVARIAGAKYFFDKSMEFEKVGVLLSQLATSMNKSGTKK